MAILAAKLGFKVSFGQFRVISAPAPRAYRHRTVFCLKGKDYSSSVPVRYIPKKSLKPKGPESSPPSRDFKENESHDSLNSTAFKGARSLAPVRHQTKESLKVNKAPLKDLRKSKSFHSFDSAAFKGEHYSSSPPVSYTAKKSLKATEPQNSRSFKDLSKTDGCDSIRSQVLNSRDFHVPVRSTPKKTLETNEPENSLPFKALTLNKSESCDNLDLSASKGGEEYSSLVTVSNSLKEPSKANVRENESFDKWDSSALQSMDLSILVRHTSKKSLEASEPPNSLLFENLTKIESCNDLDLHALEGVNSSSILARYTLDKSLEANAREILQPLKDMGKNEFCDSFCSNQLKDGDYSSSDPIRNTTKKSLKAYEPENSPPLEGLSKNESCNSLDLSAMGIKVMNNGTVVARSITSGERSCMPNGVRKNNVSHDKQEEEIVDEIVVKGNEIMEEPEEIDQEIMINQGNDTLEENVLQAGKTMQDAENSAVKLLASRAFTAVELRKKLQGKRFPPSIIEAVIKNFQSRGLINDGLYAETFSQSRWSSSSWGPRRIKQALSKKGISEGDAEKAIRLVFEDGKSSGDQESNLGMSKLSMDHLLSQASKQWFRGQDVSKETRKSRIIRWLQYRGFNWGVIGFILRKLESQYPS